jgi:hypothetical protein
MAFISNRINKLKIVFYSILVVLLCGCVAGAPKLTDEQSNRVLQIEVFKKEDKPIREFIVLDEISAAICTEFNDKAQAINSGKSILILMHKAAALNADAVIDVSCGGIPYVNNCWLAQKCDGKAVKWN